MTGAGDEHILNAARTVVSALSAPPDPLPLISACAVAGNAWQENRIEPVTEGPKDHGSDGMLQWRLDRLDALMKWPNWDTLQVQCAFFKAECKQNYPNLWAVLTNPQGRSLATLTADICDFYERPSAAGRVLDTRIEYATRVYNAVTQASPSPVPPVSLAPYTPPPQQEPPPMPQYQPPPQYPPQPQYQQPPQQPFQLPPLTLSPQAVQLIGKLVQELLSNPDLAKEVLSVVPIIIQILTKL